VAAAGLVALFYRHWRKRDGLGLGDVKLIGALGAWLGPDGLPTAVLFGVVLALIYVLARTLSGGRPAASDKIPLGAFLAVGGWLVWLLGPLIPAG
jgi:leader peptidase (prepilin peptidase)/N-methyltransferase